MKIKSKHNFKFEEEKKNYGAGGIIPYDLDSQQNVYIILNCENFKYGRRYSFFGGTRDTTDKNCRHTALREAHEESYDIINEKNHLPMTTIINKLKNEDFFCISSKFKKNGKWIWNNIYFVRINMKKWIKKHNGIKYLFDGKNKKVKNNETSMMKWVKLKDIDNKNIRGFIKQILIIFRNHLARSK